MEIIGDTGRTLQQDSVLKVRNRIDHSSEAFPTKEDIGTCCDIIEKTISRLETVGFVPTVFVTKSIETDIYARTTVTSIDYAGRELVWTPSPGLKGIRSLPVDRPTQIIVRSIYVPGTDEIVRLNLTQESDFTRLWKEYPKRRKPTDADKRAAGERLT
jgi:hypothetical protein